MQIVNSYRIKLMEIATRRREQEVWQACDDLWALSGDMAHMTGDAIRERLLSLGKSRGSPNEIYKYRKTWVQSRGVSSTQEIHGESDPISRAVRMVHENLQNESLEKIELLKAEHEQEIFKKDEEIKSYKSSIDSLMEEFRDLKNNLEQISLKLKEKSLEHDSEVEIRKVLERDLSLQKVLREQELKSKDLILQELKIAHGLEISKQAKLIEDLLAQKKLLGQEYSENLTAQKINLHNQEILTKEQEKIALSLESELLAMREKFIDQEQKITWLKEENGNLAKNIVQKDQEILSHKSRYDLVFHDRKTFQYALKKAELQIAKLRLINRS
jgi:hypothetical protein